MKILSLSHKRLCSYRITHVLFLTLFSLPVWAHDLTINLTGKIYDATCTLSADSTNKSVPMATVSAKSFSQPGNTTSPVKFTLNLENCATDMNGVEVTMAGAADANNPKLLALDPASDTATGIAIALQDEDHTLIPVNGTSKLYSLNPQGGNATLVFYAEYMATGGEVSAGEADASATFSMIYP